MLIESVLIHSNYLGETMRDRQITLYRMLHERIEDSNIPPLQRLLLMVLIVYNGEDNRSRLSYEEIARVTGLSSGSIRVHLRALKDDGHISYRKIEGMNKVTFKIDMLFD